MQPASTSSALGFLTLARSGWARCLDALCRWRVFGVPADTSQTRSFSADAALCQPYISVVPGAPWRPHPPRTARSSEPLPTLSLKILAPSAECGRGSAAKSKEIWPADRKAKASSKGMCMCSPGPRVRRSPEYRQCKTFMLPAQFVQCSLSLRSLLVLLRLRRLPWSHLSGPVPAPLSAAAHWALACARCTQPGSRLKPGCR